jgi:hypothetical protein
VAQCYPAVGRRRGPAEHGEPAAQHAPSVRPHRPHRSDNNDGDGPPNRATAPTRPGYNRGLRVWIDIETPPQVRYLLPFKTWFEGAGAHVLVTARDDGATYRLLENEQAEFRPIGRQPGRSRAHKVAGLMRRARALASLARKQRVDLLLSASRPATLAARYLRLPSFFIGDYEFSDYTVQRMTRTWVLFPDLIDPQVWRIRPDRQIPFRGIKEDLSFGAIALDDYPPHRFSGIPDGVPVLLFRPPGERVHYHREESTSFAAELLDYLAGQGSVQVVYAPRYDFQKQALEGRLWKRPPLVLHEPVHFVSLLKGVDLVVSSGGTMVREAAYLGVPAYSIIQGRVGAVDRYLESLGRLHFVASSADFGSIELETARRQSVLDSNPHLGEEILAEVISRAPRARGARTASS